jgi:hypothetical protein
MTKRSRTRSPTGGEFIDEIEARQRNVVWPGPQVNSRLVGKLLWQGSPGATIVQRIGLSVFGLVYLLAGLACLSFAKGTHSPLLAIFAFPWILLGARVLHNAFRKRKISKQSK